MLRKGTLGQRKGDPARQFLLAERVHWNPGKASKHHGHRTASVFILIPLVGIGFTV